MRAAPPEDLNQAAIRDLISQLNRNEAPEQTLAGAFDFLGLLLQLDVMFLHLYESQDHRLIFFQELGNHSFESEFLNFLRAPLIPLSKKMGREFYGVYRMKKSQVVLLDGSSYFLIPLLLAGKVVAILTLVTHPRNLTTPVKNSIELVCELLVGPLYSHLLLQRNDRLWARMETEINLAREIQNKLLPPGPPKVPGLRIAFKFSPMNKLAGDFLDFTRSREGSGLGFIVCDVSGHGVHAAFLAGMIKIALRPWELDPAHPVRNLKRLQEALKGKMAGNYLTMAMGYLEVDTGRLILSSAGHPPMLILRANGELERIEIRGRAILDYFARAFSYTQKEHKLEVGDKLVIYTDGAYESRDKDGGRLWEENFFQMIELYGKQSPEYLCQDIYDQVLHLTEGDGLQDDFTLLVIEYQGDGDG